MHMMQQWSYIITAKPNQCML